MNKISMSQTCLYNVSYKKLPDFYNHQLLQGAFEHNTNLATVHRWVTVGSWSMEYEYKLLHQFTTTVGGLGAIYGLNRTRAIVLNMYP